MSRADLQSVERAMGGDREATTRLVARLRPVVQAEVARLLLPVSARRNRADLEDLVQDVFVALWDRSGALLRRWDPERGRTLESYARMVARSRGLDALRRRRWVASEVLEPALVDGETVPSRQDGEVFAREQLLAVQDRLRDRLSERDQRLFFALFVEERSPAETAGELGMTADAVYQWSSRFRRKQLPRLLAELSATGPLAEDCQDAAAPAVGASKP